MKSQLSVRHCENDTDLEKHSSINRDLQVKLDKMKAENKGLKSQLSSQIKQHKAETREDGICPEKWQRICWRPRTSTCDRRLRTPESCRVIRWRDRRTSRPSSSPQKASRRLCQKGSRRSREEGVRWSPSWKLLGARSKKKKKKRKTLLVPRPIFRN